MTSDRDVPSCDEITVPADDTQSIRIELVGDGVLGDRVHRMSVREAHAVNAAIASGRPLLVRGDPGTGKSQLARAAAAKLGRAFIEHVIEAQTEARDLLWTFDAVRRLADAQMAGTLKRPSARRMASLDVADYLHPGPLWWVFDCASARRQAERVRAAVPPQPDGGRWDKGCVLLLDEIDKAEPELPNGLLQALGARRFTPVGRRTPVVAADRPPLVVVTSNEERALPDAFVRRCLVLPLAMPDRTELIARGQAHFPEAGEALLDRAAELVLQDREAARRARLRPLPGASGVSGHAACRAGLAEG